MLERNYNLHLKLRLSCSNCQWWRS